MTDDAPPAIRLVKIDFDALMNEAVREKRRAQCPHCEEYRYLCWCGVCIAQCHDDHFHEDVDEPLFWPDDGEAP